MGNDAISVAPDRYKVVFENDRVRLLEYSGSKGDKAAMHSHPDPVAYALTDVAATFTFPNGESVDTVLEAGQAMWNDALSHETEATGDGESRVLLIELK
jgi:hypothetical protein